MELLLQSLQSITSSNENNRIKFKTEPSSTELEAFAARFPEDLKKITDFRTQTSEVKKLNDEVRLISSLAEFISDCKPATEALRKKIQGIKKQVREEQDSLTAQIFETIRTKSVRGNQTIPCVTFSSGDSLLHAAAWRDDAETIKKLLEAGIAVDERNDEGKTALMEAARLGRIETAKILLDAGAQINLEDQHKETALAHALRVDEKEMAAFLVSRGAIISTNPLKTAFVRALGQDLSIDELVRMLNQPNIDLNFTIGDDENTPLIEAAQSIKKYPDWQKVINRLLELKVDINAVNVYGGHALHYASARDNIALAQQLLDHGAEPTKSAKDGKPPLYDAIEAKASSIVELLEKRGARHDVLTPRGQSFLHLAAVEEDDEDGEAFIKTFLELKTPSKEFIDLRDQDGKTALLRALENNNTDSATTLIKAGASLDIADSKGVTALDVACEIHASELLYNYLKGDPQKLTTFVDKHTRTLLHIAAADGDDWGSDLIHILANSPKEFINRKDEAGKTALHIAVEEDNGDEAKALIQAGADSSICDSSGMSAFEKARLKKRADILFEMMKAEPQKLLLPLDKSGKTLLHLAVEDGDTDTLDELLAIPQISKEFINTQDSEGKTALFYAVEKNNTTVARTLILAGADGRLTDTHGISALQKAQEACDVEILLELLGSDEKALLDCANSHKETLLHMAAKDKNLLESRVKDLPKEYLNRQDDEGKTALLVALEHDNEEFAKALAEDGADSKIEDKHGMSAFKKTQEKNLVRVLFLMLKNDEKALFGYRDAHAKTLLHLAVEKDAGGIYETLLALPGITKEFLDNRDDEGKTALFCAIEENEAYLAKQLLAKGADSSIPDKAGTTPLQKAISKEEGEVIYLLLKDKPKELAKILTPNKQTILHLISKENRYPSYYGPTTLPEAPFATKEFINRPDDQGKTALHVAVENGSSFAMVLIKTGKVDFSIQDKRGQTALQKAIERNDTGLIYELFKATNTDISSFVTSHKQTILHLFAKQPSSVQSDSIFENPACRTKEFLNRQDDEGKTALHIALESDKFSGSCALVEAGADGNIKDSLGQTALELAKEKGAGEVLYALLKDDADALAAFSDDKGHTILHLLAERGDCSCLDLPFATKEFINRKDQNGKTALHLAIEGYRTSVAIELIAHGADCTIEDNEGQTPLSIAKKHGEASLLFAMMKDNPKELFSFVGDDGQTLLHKLSSEYDHIPLMQLLSLPGITKEFLDRKDKNGKTALHYAVNKCYPAAEALFTAGASSSIQDREGKTAFQIACEQDIQIVCEKGNLHLASQLLNDETDCNFTIGPDQNSPLMEAVRKGHEALALKLCFFRKSLNATNAHHQTALHLACTYYQKLIGPLLEASCDPNIVDDQGYTPLSLFLRDTTNLSPDVLKQFVAKGTNLNTLLPNGRTLLMQAIYEGKEYDALALLDAGADPNFQGKNGQSAITTLLQRRDAFISSHPTFISNLIEKGADLAVFDSNGNSLLHRLSSMCYSDTDCREIAESLKLRTLPPELLNKQNNQGETALLVAAKNARLRWAGFLLIHKADPTLPDKTGLDPLAALFAKPPIEPREVETVLHLQQVVGACLLLGASPDITLPRNTSLLHYAAQYDWPEIVVSALSKTKNKQELLERKNEAGKTALEVALDKDSLTCARALLTAGASWDSPSILNKTATCVYHPEMVLEMLKKEAPGPLGTCAFLNKVIQKSDTDKEWQVVLDRLLELDVDRKVKNDEAETPLEVACQRNNQALIWRLLERGAKPERDLGGKSRSALLLLCQSHSIANPYANPYKPGLIEKFREKGANLNICEVNGTSPLLEALSYNSRDTRSLAIELLAAGADPNCENKDHETPLSYAIRSKDGVLIEALLAKGVRLDCRKHPKLSLFELAEVEYPLFIEMCISHLKTHGKATEPIDEKGNTILHAAADVSLASTVMVMSHKELLTEEFLNRKNKEGKTALDIALDAEDREQVTSLVDAGVTFTDPCALSKALNKKVPPSTILKMLENPGVQVNQAQVNDSPPLLVTIYKKSQNPEWGKVVDRLLELNADIHAKNSDGDDSLALACKTADWDLAKKLLKAGARPNEKRTTPPLVSIAKQRTHVIDESLLDLFLEKGVDLNATDNEGYTALYHSLQDPINEKMALWLLKSGANPNFEDADKKTALGLAIECSSFVVVKKLIELKVNLNAQDDDGNTPLHVALENEEAPLAHLILDAGADPKIANKREETPLHLAVHLSNQTLVKKLLQKGADINAFTSSQYTPLASAIELDASQIALFLLDNGANPNLFAGTPLLHLAIARRNDAIVKKLLEKGTNVLSVDATTRTTALEKAASQKYEEYINILIDVLKIKGSNFSNLDGKNSSFLHLVAATGHAPFIKAVLQRTKPSKALINTPNEAGKTALALATEQKTSEGIELLLAAGADPALKTKEGKNSLELAFEHDMPKAALAILAAPGLDLNFTLSSGRTALCFACSRLPEWAPVALRLLDSDIKNIDQKDATNNTPLAYATRKKNWSLVKKLLEKGANPNIKIGTSAETILHMLVTENESIDQELLRLFREKGADFNLTNEDGETALFVAVREDRKEELLDALIDNGARVDVVTKKGKTLLDVAANRRDRFITFFIAACEKQKISLNNIDGQNSTLLHWAAKSGHNNFVTNVLSLPSATKEFICQKNQKKESALHHAFLGQNPNSILKLLNFDPDLNFIVGDELLPPLLVAQILLYRAGDDADDWRAVLSQLMKVCDKNLCDKNGRTPLHLACEAKKYNDITFYLEWGVDPSKRTLLGKTALMMLAEANPPPQKAIVEQLLAKKADIDAQDNSGRTAFIIACENENEEIAVLLHDKGANTALLPKNKKAPLGYFLLQGWFPAFTKAIEGGAVLNSIDKDGNTLLHLAIQKFGPEFLECLLNQKSLNIDIYARNKEGKTFIDYLPHNQYARYYVEILFKPIDLKAGTDFQQFLAALEADPTPTVGHDRSPFEIAFLLGNPNIIRTMLVKGDYTKEDLNREVEELSKKYISPYALAFTSPVEQFRMNTLHTIELKHIDKLPAIPPAPQDIQPEALIALFEKAAIPHDELGCKSKEEGSKKLAEFFRRLDSKDLQHQQIAAACCHLARRIEKNGIDKTAIFRKLFDLLDKKGSPLYVGFLELYGQLGVQKLPDGVTADNIKDNFSGDQKALEAFLEKVKTKNLAGLEQESPKYGEIAIALAHIAQALTVPGLDRKSISEKLSALFSASGSALHTELQKLARTVLIDAIPALFLTLDASHWATFNISSKDEVPVKAQELTQFIKKITNKQLMGLNPETGSATYEQMEVALGRVASFMLANKGSQIEIFTELFRLFAVCGPALYSEILELFYKTCRSIPLTCENALLLSLENFRRSLVKGIISSTIQSAQTRHDYIGLIKTYPELGLPEAAELGSFDDVYHGCANQDFHLDVMNTFWRRYNASTLVEWVMLHFLGDGEHKKRFIDYMKTQIPATFHPELAKEDRESAFLSEVVYDEQLVNIRHDVVIGELVKMGILRG